MSTSSLHAEKAVNTSLFMMLRYGVGDVLLTQSTGWRKEKKDDPPCCFMEKFCVMDDPEFKANRQVTKVLILITFLSTQQDVRISESIVVDHPSLDNVKTVVVPFQRQKYPGKACVSHYVPLSSTEVKCKKRRHIINSDKTNIVIKTPIGPDGNEIPLFPWKEGPRLISSRIFTFYISNTAYWSSRDTGIDHRGLRVFDERNAHNAGINLDGNVYWIVIIVGLQQ
ncbi:hypothetical protein Tco_0494492 [Tanacetum coccineum]